MSKVKPVYVEFSTYEKGADVLQLIGYLKHMAIYAYRSTSVNSVIQPFIPV